MYCLTWERYYKLFGCIPLGSPGGQPNGLSTECQWSPPQLSIFSIPTGRDCRKGVYNNSFKVPTGNNKWKQLTKKWGHDLLKTVHTKKLCTGGEVLIFLLSLIRAVTLAWWNVIFPLIKQGDDTAKLWYLTPLGALTDVMVHLFRN